MSNTDRVVVVGAGPGGIGAAYAAASAGASVILIDEQEAPGGWLRTSLAGLEQPVPMLEGVRGTDIAENARDFLAEAGVEYRYGNIAWGLFENGLLGVVGPDSAYQLDASTIILATGSTDIVWPFEGWTLPGVMTARAARAFMHLHYVLPGRQVAIIGRGPDADQMVADLDAAGADAVHRFDTPDNVAVAGDRTVQGISSDGSKVGVDAVILALGSLPDPELARHAVADLQFSEADGCHVPVRNAHMMTSVDGLYLVGDAGGLTTAAEAMAQGFIAGFAATGSEKLSEAIGILTDLSSQRPSHSNVGTASLIPDDVEVDREEQVTARTIRAAIASGSMSVNDVKRKTRAGMGVSQGRDTEYVIARMINDQTGIPLDDLVPMTARPPARLVPLASLSRLAATVD